MARKPGMTVNPPLDDDLQQALVNAIGRQKRDAALVLQALRVLLARDDKKALHEVAKAAREAAGKDLEQPDAKSSGPGPFADPVSARKWALATAAHALRTTKSARGLARWLRRILDVSPLGKVCKLRPAWDGGADLDAAELEQVLLRRKLDGATPLYLLGVAMKCFGASAADRKRELAGLQKSTRRRKR
jgi:hypothetical protein